MSSLHFRRSTRYIDSSNLSIRCEEQSNEAQIYTFLLTNDAFWLFSIF